MSHLRTNLQPKRQWPLKLCDCFSYRDKKGQQRWWPTFCCTAMICTNMIAGRVHSKVFKENILCCGLGCQGALICLLSLPLGFYHPLAGMAGFCCYSNFLRANVLYVYNVEEEKTFCCGPVCNEWLDYCHFGCNYPCSFFQMHIAMEAWDDDAMPSVSIITPIHAQPIVTTKVVYN